MSYCDGAHHGQGDEPSSRCIVDLARERLARRSAFNRIMDEMQGIRWSPLKAALLKDAIDRATDHNLKVT